VPIEHSDVVISQPLSGYIARMWRRIVMHEYCGLTLGYVHSEFARNAENDSFSRVQTYQGTHTNDEKHPDTITFTGWWKRG